MYSCIKPYIPKYDLCIGPTSVQKVNLAYWCFGTWCALHLADTVTSKCFTNTIHGAVALAQLPSLFRNDTNKYSSY